MTTTKATLSQRMRAPAAPSDDLDPIALLVELQRQFGSCPSYQLIWQHLASARIPARREGRHWRIRRSDVPTIARFLGLA